MNTCSTSSRRLWDSKMTMFARKINEQPEGCNDCGIIIHKAFLRKCGSNVICVKCYKAYRTTTIAPYSKKCPRCKKDKKIILFGRNKLSPNGHTTICRECSRAYEREYRLANPEKTKKPKREARRLQTNYRRKNKDRARANQLLQLAVRQKRIKKPSQCEVCYAGKPKNLIHGHHEDYSKPYKIIWCCHGCHKDIHTYGLPKVKR